jgi:outer membrane protein assembly factor BamB
MVAANGVLFAFDRSGGVKWQFDLEGFPSQCAPTISKDGRIIFISSGDPVNHPRKLYAINSDGTLRWTFGGEVGKDKLYIYSPAFSPDGTTLYLPGVAKIFAVDTSGKELWEFPTGGEISASCVDNHGNIYVAGKMAYCFAPDGSVKWTRPLANTNEPPMPSIGWDGTVYVSSSEAGPPGGIYVHAYQQGGVLKWMQFVGNFSQGQPVSDVDGTVYVGSNGRFADTDSTSLFAINAAGTYKFRLTLRSTGGTVPDISSTPAIGLGNKIYVGCDAPNGKSLFAIY